jgi:hypothetical protein
MPDPIVASAVTLTLGQIQIKPNVAIEEVTLSSDSITIEPSSEKGQPPRIQAGETRFSGVLTEPNLNALVASVLANSPTMRDVQVALMSGKAKITGQYVKLLPVPFNVEAVPIIENGIRLVLDVVGSSTGIISHPNWLVNFLETNVVSKVAVDLGKLPFPVWLDEARCEPGRLVLQGKARLEYPFVPKTVTSMFRTPLPSEIAAT